MSECIAVVYVPSIWNGQTPGVRHTLVRIVWGQGFTLTSVFAIEKSCGRLLDTLRYVDMVTKGQVGQGWNTSV